eukprot:NODE_368_length_10016_cov_0.215791.p6 type:complete len:158 gc:universal NODE_368_length_10016_cov_0.215791:7015-7488(+)
MSENSCQKLLKLLFTHFPHFRDVGEFKGKRVYILKRAQILVADIWAAFEGNSYGRFSDIDTITMFADYRVPQSLVALGMLEYDENALYRIEKEELQHNDPLELEIRGNSIYSVELLKRCLKDYGIVASSITLDFYLWKYAKERTLKAPVHRTRSIFY